MGASSSETLGPGPLYPSSRRPVLKNSSPGPQGFPPRWLVPAPNGLLIISNHAFMFCTVLIPQRISERRKIADSNGQIVASLFLFMYTGSLCETEFKRSALDMVLEDI